jgi:hypothetical protein
MKVGPRPNFYDTVALIELEGGQSWPQPAFSRLWPPERRVGTSSKAQTVVVTNNQTTSLAISGVTVGGADPGDFPYTSACTATLLADAKCTISVTFKPATGSRTASASLLVNDTLGTQTVSLSGTGQ